ncbi:uncharacterized protein MAM_02013 [Metarhizium album ARSEF 1941]|uniref:Uncharacterized protein n=1 Tax=Metarhizium album (strain ARSEF 1941) TaxID=1081103 RepID=A0A0B2X3T3_METAS|nr:uncharacterized protein MAM_02013 [Metarhizium album ARSEF 1941]KHO00090.1 hypothetical protein MAM_02013 [Metarhizium album ARSEF 1941]
MALSIRQLNWDASFLLTFEPVRSDPIGCVGVPQLFRILLDPWLVGPSNIFHSKFSSTTHVQGACVSTLRDLPEPDLVIVSNGRSDHCNEATLRQLAPCGTKTTILAEPTAAKLIRSWGYFDERKIVTLQRWQDPRHTGRDTAIRIPIRSGVAGGDGGLVTVSFISRRRNTKGVDSAIGITYRPTPSGLLTSRSPPPTASTRVSTPSLKFASGTASPTDLYTPETLDTPTLPLLPALPPLRPAESPVSHPSKAGRSLAALHARNRRASGVSVILSPHGISYSAIEGYATSHLVSEATLPLTALLHCFDAISQPWWLGGNLTSGFHDGQEIISKLGARAWISTYDGDKFIRGLAKRLTRRKKYKTYEVRRFVHGVTAGVHGSRTADSKRGGKMDKPTEIMALNVGEEIVLTSDGLWVSEETAVVEPGCLNRHLSIPYLLSANACGEGIGSQFRVSQLWPSMFLA